MSLNELAHQICGAETIEDIISAIDYNDAGDMQLDPTHCNRLAVNLNRADTLDLLVSTQFVDLIEQLKQLANLHGTNYIKLTPDFTDIITKTDELSAALSARRVVGYIPISRYVQEGSGTPGEYGGTLGSPQQAGDFSYCQQYLLLLWSDGVVTELDGITVVDIDAIQDMVGYCQTAQATPDNTEHLYVLEESFRSPTDPVPVIKPF